MPFRETTALHKILRMDKRLRIVQGGARAGKTIAIITILIDIAQTRNKKVISVVGESVPFLKRGSIRDFLQILKEQNYYDDSAWNRTDFIYTFPTGSIIEFFSADNPGKVRGPSRHILFINEANNVSYETYTQLAIRTSEFIFIDYNPVSEFYAHTELIPKQEHDFVICTYKDNEALSPLIVDEIESRRGNKYFWKVFGLGELGEMEGKIYKDWALVDEIPHEARIERYGIDFGYSNDPTAIVAIYYYNGGYIVDERLYLKGQSNKQIADFMINQTPGMAVADSAEPKSIDELISYGINVIPAQKGAGSVTQGIQFVQDKRMSITKRSLNVIKEYRNYLWQTDKDGKILNDPEKGWDHAMDAVRYAMESLRPIEDKPPRTPRRYDEITGRLLT